MDYCVYWLYDETCSDPWHDGYIGVTNDHMRRFKEHEKSNRFPTGFKIKIVFEGTEIECLEQENFYRPDVCIGWNIMYGGGKPPSYLGRKHTEKTKEKMRRNAAKRPIEYYDRLIQSGSSANRGKKWSIERRRKHGERLKGVNNWTKGSKQTPETKEKIRQAMKGRNVTPGWKISLGKKGKKLQKIICECCGKVCVPGMYKRWHGVNCREGANVTR